MKKRAQPRNSAVPEPLSKISRLAPLTRGEVRLLLVLVLAIAAFLRFYHLTFVPAGLYTDEAMNGNNAMQALETGAFRVFYPENNGREGLYINAVALSVAVFGRHPWAVRLPSAIFGTLTVWGMYCLGAELFAPGVGLLAAFFTATSFWHIDFSRISVRAISAPFFLVWALYLFFLGMRRLRTRKNWLPAIGGAGLLYGLGFHTYIAYRATPPLVAGLLISYFLESGREGWRPAFWKSTLAFVSPALLAVLPLAFYFIAHPHDFSRRTESVSVFAAAHPLSEAAQNTWKTLRMFFVSGDRNWRHNYPARPEIFWPVAVLLALGMVMAVREFFRRGKRASVFPFAVVLAWLMLAAVPSVFSDAGIPHALRAILDIPAAFLLAAAAAAWLYRVVAPACPRPLRILGLGLLFLALCYQPYHWYFEVWAVDPNVPRAFSQSQLEVAAAINALPGETAKYVVVGDPGELENGIPMFAQTVAFLTGSYTEKGRETVHMRYVVPDESILRRIPVPQYCRELRESNPGAAVFCLDHE